MTTQVRTTLTALAVMGVMAIPVRADDDGGGGRRAFRADMFAGAEVPFVSSGARGTFRARLSDDGTSFEYTLNYEGFEGTVTQSHIHIAQPFASGGISVWLCKTAAVTPPTGVPADVPTCGAPGGVGPEAEGVISAEDVIGPTGQAVPAARVRRAGAPDALGRRLRERALHLRSGRRGARPESGSRAATRASATKRRVPLAPASARGSSRFSASDCRWFSSAQSTKSRTSTVALRCGTETSTRCRPLRTGGRSTMRT